jgi:KamA family protein
MNSVVDFQNLSNLDNTRLTGDPFSESSRFQVFTERQWDKIPQLKRLPEELQWDMRAVASVLPFRVNQYVIDYLIQWDNIPEDPIFQLTFPQPGMLDPGALQDLKQLIKHHANRDSIKALVAEIRAQLNPHPAGQKTLNIPHLDGKPLQGMQHKYKETVLFFPSQGQTCHSYCSFCFRWAQFIGDKELRFSASEANTLHRYLKKHKEVTDLLITGGDPMVMKTRHFSEYLLPLATPELEHIKTVRIGTKALTFWPQRFVTDPDADELLRLLEHLVSQGKHVALMAHYNHWRELETPIAHEAIRRIQNTGAIIRSQGPLLAHINDDADVWAKLWKTQVNRGIVPYYMFVERDTGAKRYFEVPLAKAWRIYQDAIQKVSGLARTARGPSMSAGPGKVEIQGVTEVAGEKVFVLRFIQGRNADWVQKPFFAKYDENATWLNHLEPAVGQEEFFYEAEYQSLIS